MTIRWSINIPADVWHSGGRRQRRPAGHQTNQRQTRPNQLLPLDGSTCNVAMIVRRRDVSEPTGRCGRCVLERNLNIRVAASCPKIDRLAVCCATFWTWRSALISFKFMRLRRSRLASNSRLIFSAAATCNAIYDATEIQWWMAVKRWEPISLSRFFTRPIGPAAATISGFWLMELFPLAITWWFLNAFHPTRWRCVALETARVPSFGCDSTRWSREPQIRRRRPSGCSNHPAPETRVAAD